jgi:hypothetical protein
VSSHILYAVLSGTLVAGAWAFVRPLQLDLVPTVGAGYVLGVAVYALIAVAHAYEQSN